MTGWASSGQVSPVKEKRWDITFLLVLLSVSLGLNVFLGWEVKRLRYAVVSSTDSRHLSVGDSMPPITAGNLNDAKATITYGGITTPTVLYFFSPTCIWCERNIESIKTLARLRGDTYRFVGFSLSEKGLKEYLGNHQLNFPVYRSLSPDSIHVLGLGGTPQTMLISTEGKVLKNWIGAYGADLKLEVEEYFGISLPPLAATPQVKPSDSLTSSQSCSD